jgi:hypothetical protein
MGVGRKILTENTYVTMFSDLLKPFLMSSKKAIKGAANKVMVGNFEVLKSSFDDFLRAIDNPATYDLLTSAEKKLFGEIVAQNTKIVDDVYKALVTDFMKKSGNKGTEKALISVISDELESGKTIREILTEMDEGIEDIFKNEVVANKIMGKVRELRLNKFTTEVESLVKPSTALQPTIKKVGKKIATLSPSDDLKWLNRVLASNKTLVNILRPLINDSLIKYEQKTIKSAEEIEKTIENVFQDILRTTNKVAGNLKNIDTDKIITELRNTAQKIDIIQETFEADKSALYDEIEKALIENMDEASKIKIPKIMENMRKADPFRGLEEGEKWHSRSYVLNFLDNTATQQTLYNVGRIMRNVFRKSKWGKLAEDIQLLISRIPGLLVTGAPKTWREILSYFNDIGPKKGLWLLTKHLWFATHIGLPLTMAAFHTLQNVVLLMTSPIFGIEKDTIEKDYMDNLKNDFLSQYQGYPLGIGNDDFDDDINAATIAIGAIAPGHIFLDDVAKWIGGKLDKAERGELRPEATPAELARLFVKYKISKPIQQKLTEAANSKTVQEAEEIIKNATETVNNTVDKVKEKTDNTIEKVKEKTQEISIVDDIKPAAPCLFTDSSAGGWTVELTEKGYVTHNQDWSQKYYLDVTKKDGVTTVYYRNTTTKTCK